MMDIYNVESTIVRANKIFKNNKNSKAIEIAKVISSDMVDQIEVSSRKIAFSIQQHGPSNISFKKLKKMVEQMRLNTDTIQLKREIANYVFNENKYPY